jgi:signal transduction histidine kinase
LKLRRLGAELREHYDALRQQRDDMLRLQLQKERLITFVVHDLKNHVNAMDLHAQLLLRDPALSEGGRQSAQQIRSAARQLVRMILNLLDISKADEGKLVAKRTDVDLGVLVQSVTGELELAATERRIAFKVELESRRVRADEDLLRRTLANLIENAIRHAPKDSVVRVTSERKAETIDIRVADTGAGVPSAMRDKIFDPYVRLETDDWRSTRTGRGLGLTFCKLAVEAQAGRIWVEDGTPGAVFVMRLADDR